MTMQKSGYQQFLIDRGQAHLEVLVDGRYVRLRKTVHQIEAYEAYEATKKAAAEEAKAAAGGAGQAPIGGAAVLRQNVADALELCLIALNPDPGKTEFDRARLEKALDADQMELLAQAWLGKLFAPRMDADPRLAPREGAA